MDQLTERNYNILQNAVKATGSYDPEELDPYFEQVRVSEYPYIVGFLKWVHKNPLLTFGRGNYESLYEKWLNSDFGLVECGVCGTLMQRQDAYLCNQRLYVCPDHSHLREN